MRLRTSVCLGLLTLLAACSSLPDWAGGKAEEKPKLPGTRLAVLPSEMLPADPALQGVTVTVPPAAANTQWPQHMGTPRASIGNLAVAENFSEKASQRIGDGHGWEEPLVISPVIGGEMVFAMDAVGTVSAHDAKVVETVRWVSHAAVPTDEEEILGGGLAYEMGKLYVATGRGLIVALDASSGKELWRQRIGLPFRSAPKIDSGRLLAVSVDNQIFALNTASGTILWSSRGIDETASYLNAVSPAAAGGLVVAPYSSGQIQVLKAEDGSELWNDSLILPKRTLATSVFSGIGADPVIHGNMMIVVGSGGMMGAYEFSTGQHLWQQSLSAVNTPWLAGDFIYVLTVDNQLVCLARADGRIKWVKALASYENEEKREGPRVWTGPVMAGGRLLVTGAHGEMLILSPADGTLIESRAIPEGIYAAPVIANGSLYLVDRDATLHQLN